MKQIDRRRGAAVAAVFLLLLAPNVLAQDGARSGAATAERAGPALDYPQSERTDHVDELHGETIADPYRWLEDENAPATRAWIEAQNGVTGDYLASLPERAGIRRRLEDAWNHERFTLPTVEAGRYFWRRNDGLQNQSVLWMSDGLDGEPRVVLDPNTWTEDGTQSLASFSVSRDARFIAYGIADGGSDWRSFRILDLMRGGELEETIEWVKFGGVSWDVEGLGFYYPMYPPPAEGQQLSAVNRTPRIMYHRIGTPQERDRVVFERPDQPDWMLGASVTDDGRALVLYATSGSTRDNGIFILDLTTADAEPRPLVDSFDARYRVVSNVRDNYWLLTDRDAPNNRLVRVDLNDPAPAEWVTVIPESADALRSVSAVANYYFASYLEHAASRVVIYDQTGKTAGEVDLPGLGSASGFAGRRTDRETFYSYESFTEPSAIYRLDISTLGSEVWRQPDVPFDGTRFTTRQVFYESKDGTRVPMFLTHLKGLELDGNNPTLLYGYGGFNIAQVPRFRVPTAVWLDMGGVFATACLRGGGEYGEDWHEAGTKLQKQNVFDDFIAAAEWLIAEGYTSSEKLAIHGRSNGGLLVGAVLNQRPDLFGAALPAVGVMDMLRFHEFTIGWAWQGDYGSPDVPEEFAALRAYSPYHNVRADTAYPSVLISTADHDDRVVPAHSFKYAAALQHAHAGDAPVLIRIETRAGHGAGKPVTMAIEEAADQWAFLAHELGMEVGGVE